MALEAARAVEAELASHPRLNANFDLSDALSKGSYAIVGGVAHPMEVAYSLGSSASFVTFTIYKRTKENVAVKIYNRRGIRTTRAFKNEIKMLWEARKLKSDLFPHLIIAFALNLSYVMATDLEETDLSMLIAANREKALRVDVISRMIDCVLAGLRFLLDRGYIHNAIRPSNILSDKNGSIFKLTNLSQMISVDEKTSASTENLESAYLPYVCPEQLLELSNAELVGRDIWSLGCVVGECILNTRVFPELDRKLHLCSIMELIGFPPNRIMAQSILRVATEEQIVPSTDTTGISSSNLCLAYLEGFKLASEGRRIAVYKTRGKRRQILPTIKEPMDSQYDQNMIDRLNRYRQFFKQMMAYQLIIPNSVDIGLVCRKKMRKDNFKYVVIEQYEKIVEFLEKCLVYDCNDRPYRFGFQD